MVITKHSYYYYYFNEFRHVVNVEFLFLNTCTHIYLFLNKLKCLVCAVKVQAFTTTIYYINE